MRLPFLITIALLLLGCTKQEGLTSLQSEEIYTAYDKGSITIDELRSSLDSAITQNDRRKEGLIKLSLGKRLRNNSQFDQAMQMHKSAQDIAYELSDTLMLIKSYNEIGTLFRRIDALNEAIKSHYSALRYSELYSDSMKYVARKQKTIALNGVGNISLSLEFYDKAEESFRECIKIESELGSDIGLAINYANLGAIFTVRDQRDSAMYYYRRSLDHNIKAHSQIGESLCYSYIGDIYEANGDLDKAKEYYVKGYEKIKDHRDIWHRLVLHISIARINIKQGDYRAGRANLKQAQSYAEEISSSEHLAIIYKLWADYYEKIGNAEKAIDNLKKSYQNGDVSRKKKEQESLMQTNIDFVTDLSSERIDLQATVIEQQKNRQELLYFTVSICILALAIFAYLLSLVRSQNRRLVEVNAMKNRLFSVISHDIKNPLTSQRTVLELLVSNMDYLQKDDIKQQCHDLLRSSSSLLNLLHNLLNWSQIESKTVRYNPTNVDLYMIVSEIKEAFNIALAQKNITIQIAAKEGAVAYADHNMVCVILRNLIYNAMKYSHVGGTILLSVESESDALWRVKVQDYGVGMSTQTKENLFNLDSSCSKVGTSGEAGTGMGLVIVKEMLAFGGGKIEVESTEGEGTTISFTIKKSGVENEKS